MAEVIEGMEPIVWTSGDIRFTVDRYKGDPVVTILRVHTGEEAELAERAIKSLLDANQFVSVDEAGFQWMAHAIRLAWSEARVAVLEAERARDTIDGLFDRRLVEARDAGYRLGLEAPGPRGKSGEDG